MQGDAGQQRHQHGWCTVMVREELGGDGGGSGHHHAGPIFYYRGGKLPKPTWRCDRRRHGCNSCHGNAGLRREPPANTWQAVIDQARCCRRMSARSMPATGTGFFIASRRNGSPSSWLSTTSTKVVTPLAWSSSALAS